MCYKNINIIVFRILECMIQSATLSKFQIFDDIWFPFSVCMSLIHFLLKEQIDLENNMLVNI